jgi:exodeoxyribonuclease III
MKIVSYNLNGIRAAFKKGLPDWLASENPDIVCLQELKATQDQIDHKTLQTLGYQYNYFHSAISKAGYSGVAILSKIQPTQVTIGCNIEKYDREGRVIRADYQNFSVMSVYMPSGTSGEERQQFKYEWLYDFYTYLSTLKTTTPNLLICGDYNIAHQEIDLHNPKVNKNTSGFLQPERDWLSKFFALGFIDTFRELNPNLQAYTWWTTRTNARERNLGWRIDYIAASKALKPSIQAVSLANEAKHSDHCPVVINLFD